VAVAAGPASGPSPGPLALVGGDEFRPGNEEHDGLLAEHVRERGGPAFVVATAARAQPDAAVATAVTWFDSLGLKLVELRLRTRTDAARPAIVRAAEDAALVYLAGGDPGRVPLVLRGTPAWDAIVRAWRGGAALAGSSAGAMALGAWTLIRARIPGDPRRVPRAGLAVVPGIAVVPHFETFGHRWVASALAARDDVVLLGLDERTAAVWHDGAWTAMGAGGVTVIRGDERSAFAGGTTIDELPVPVDR